MDAFNDIGFGHDNLNLRQCHCNKRVIYISQGNRIRNRFLSYNHFYLADQAFNYFAVQRADLLVRERPFVRAVADADGDTPEPLGNAGSTVEVEDIHLLDLLRLDAAHTLDNL